MKTSTDMSIVAFSDTHGKLPELEPDSDLLCVLHAGDVFDGRTTASARGSDQGKRSGSASAPAEHTDSLDAWLERLTVPCFAVRGNHDVPLGRDSFFRSDRDVTGAVREISSGLFLAGIGWSKTSYLDLPGERDLVSVIEGIRRQALRMVFSKDRLILLSHYPPDLPELREVFPLPRKHSCSWGYKGIRELADELKPAAIIFGHIHEWAGKHGYLISGGKRILAVCPGPGGLKISIDHRNGEVRVA